MTDSAPAQLAATQGDTLARRRRLLVLAVVLALLGSSAGWFYLRISEQSRVLAAIEAAGGKYHAPDRGQYVGYALQRLFGQVDPPRGYDVLLDGPKIDDAWLAEQHQLRSLPIDELLTSDTRLSRDALMGLFNDNDLTTFNVAGAPLTDADAAIIGRQERLTHLNLQQSKISDTGLAALNPARLSALDVSGTQVTSTALQQQLTGRQLQYLGVDGKQFSPELAAQLAGMSTVNMDPSGRARRHGRTPRTAGRLPSAVVHQHRSDIRHCRSSRIAEGRKTSSCRSTYTTLKRRSSSGGRSSRGGVSPDLAARRPGSPNDNAPRIRFPKRGHALFGHLRFRDVQPAQLLAIEVRQPRIGDLRIAHGQPLKIRQFRDNA